MTKENDKIMIEIPVYYMGIIATHGNMGTGDLPDTLKYFFTRLLVNNGYGDLLAEMQKEKIAQLRKSLSNVVGKDGMQKIDSALDDAKTGLEFAKQLNQKKSQ